jgi:O-antigen ligase
MLPSQSPGENAVPIDRLVQFGLLAGGAVALIAGRRPVAGLPFVVPLFAFLLFVLPNVSFHDAPPFDGRGTYTFPVVHFAFMDAPAPAGLEWLRLAVVLVLALLASAAVRTSQRFIVLAFAIVAGALVPLADGISQVLQGEFVARGGFNAVRGPFDFPNEYAFYLLIIGTLALVAAFEMRDPRVRGAMGVVAGLSIWMLFATFTRSAWVAFATVILLLSIVRYRRVIVFALIALALALTGLPSAVNSVQERFSDLSEQSETKSANSWSWRRGQWDQMLHFGSERPLRGNGFGSYRKLTVEQFGYQDHTYKTVTRPSIGGRQYGFTAHNDYVKMWVETGVIGLALWILVLIGSIVVAVRAARIRELEPWAIAVAALGVAFAGISIADNVQSYTVSLGCMAVLTGALAGVTRAAQAAPALRRADG